jgi:hypothetical protein
MERAISLFHFDGSNFDLGETKLVLDLLIQGGVCYKLNHMHHDYFIFFLVFVVVFYQFFLGKASRTEQVHILVYRPHLHSPDPKLQIDLHQQIVLELPRATKTNPTYQLPQRAVEARRAIETDNPTTKALPKCQHHNFSSTPHLPT